MPAARVPRIKSLNRRRHGPLRILLTGFGPFPGMPFNASGALIQELGETPPPGLRDARLIAAVLPTDWRLALRELRVAIGEAKPDVAVHFGVSARARGFAIETRAFNQTCPRADCSGCQPPRSRIRASAPAAMKATLPAARLLQRLRMEGIPAGLSGDAGRYLCNAVMFESLALAEGGGARRAGFIHIPALAPPGAEPSRDTCFDWPTLRRGAAIILGTLACPAQGSSLRGSGLPCISLR